MGHLICGSGVRNTQGGWIFFLDCPIPVVGLELVSWLPSDCHLLSFTLLHDLSPCTISVSLLHPELKRKALPFLLRPQTAAVSQSGTSGNLRQCFLQWLLYYEGSTNNSYLRLGYSFLLLNAQEWVYRQITDLLSIWIHGLSIAKKEFFCQRPESKSWLTLCGCWELWQ